MKKTKERKAQEEEYLRRRLSEQPEFEFDKIRERNRKPYITITFSDIIDFFSEKVIRRINGFLFLCCFVLTSYLIFKLRNDVLYKVQFQLPLISKHYFWFNSELYCLYLVLLLFIIFNVFRCWSSIALIIFLYYNIKAYQWMAPIDVYRHASISCIIWSRELFDPDIINIYLYKTLSQAQIDWVLNYELKNRLSAISITIYRECRDLDTDLYIVHFFDDFVFDPDDSWNYERIRGQIDRYQEAKIEYATLQLKFMTLEHEYEYQVSIFLNSVKDFLINYPGEIVAVGVITMLLGVILYYNLIENPFYKDWSWFKTVEDLSDSDIDYNSDVLPNISEYELNITDALLRTFGKASKDLDPEVYISNLKFLLIQNQELMQNVTGSLSPEMLQQAIDTYIPKMLQSQENCVKILELLTHKVMNNSPLELEIFSTDIIIWVFITIIVALIIVLKNATKKKTKSFCPKRVISNEIHSW